MSTPNRKFLHYDMGVGILVLIIAVVSSLTISPGNLVQRIGMAVMVAAAWGAGALLIDSYRRLKQVIEVECVWTPDSINVRNVQLVLVASPNGDLQMHVIEPGKMGQIDEPPRSSAVTSVIVPVACTPDSCILYTITPQTNK